MIPQKLTRSRSFALRRAYAGIWDRGAEADQVVARAEPNLLSMILPESLATKGNGGLGVIFGTVFRNGLQDWSEQRRKVLWRDSKGGN
jgi:hypothetical protein